MISGILVLEVGTWCLSVRSHDGGFEVSITEDDKPPTSHYVRLDREQSETLREFINETLPSPAQSER